ncbi:MAG TPA: HipA family kinase [Gammaproteobacteria bacterium]|nr:HipA family kinase [Gammaproteobacteria bacterium]
MQVRTVTATRYVTPLREGGSLPAIVEADDDGMYVLKFRGAGQGPKTLVAELVAGEIARAAGLPVPEIVFVELDPDLARTEPDPEIQELIQASAGLNLALDYLPGSVTFDPVVRAPDGDFASAVVWFDAFVTNVDRTARNTNILEWHRKLWLIDHGAALYFHHAWNERYREHSRTPFPMIKDHVLLAYAERLEEADRAVGARITGDVIRGAVALIPDAWLEEESPVGGPSEQRRVYVDYLTGRLEARQAFLEEALRARSLHV